MMEGTAVFGSDITGVYNVAIGYRAGYTNLDSSTPWPPEEQTSDFWHCNYCGQSNNAEREGCRGCQAPRPMEEA